MRTLVLMTLLLTAGCVGRRMDAWVGRPGEQLLERWGAPDSRISLREGGKVLTYNEGWLDEDFHRCRKSFTVGPDGIIRRWQVADCSIWTPIPAPPRR